MVKKIVQTLKGEITIQSEQGLGTQVTVEIPLSTNFQRPAASNQKDSNDPVSIIQKDCQGKSVALYGFGSESDTSIRESLGLYITEWYNLCITDDVHLADFVIVDESNLDLLISSFRALPLRIIVLRDASVKHAINMVETEEVFKPVGPNGLAKSLLISWARKTINPEVSSNDTLKSQVAVRDSCCIELEQRASDAELHPEHGAQPVQLETQTKTLLAPKSLPKRSRSRNVNSKPAPKRDWQPRMLCVDDNFINLKLLEAYLQKLGFTAITSAGDGLEALNFVMSSDAQFDIIFMGK
jgi:hypothetical protein